MVSIRRIGKCNFICDEHIKVFLINLRFHRLLCCVNYPERDNYSEKWCHNYNMSFFPGQCGMKLQMDAKNQSV